MELCVLSLSFFSYDDCENICTLSYYHHVIGSMTHWLICHCLGSWNIGMCCRSFYILMNLWYGRIASWAIHVLVILLRIWSLVTNMQLHYLARHPTDDWLLENMFSQVYFSVVVCQRWLYHHSVSSGLGSCVSFNAPHTTASPSRENTKSKRLCDFRLPNCKLGLEG